MSKVPSMRNRERSSQLLPFKPPFIISLYAPPGSGKTTAVRSIVRHYAHHFSHVVVICCSPSIYEDYDFVPEQYIYTMFDEQILANLIQYQYDNECPPGLLILDDCIAQINFRSQVVRQLLTTFRHINLSVIFCSQKIKAGSTKMRDYSSFNLVFKQPNIRSMKVAAEELLERYDSWEDVRRVMSTMPRYSFILASRMPSDLDGMKRSDARERSSGTKGSPYPICKLEPVKPFRLKY